MPVYTNADLKSALETAYEAVCKAEGIAVAICTRREADRIADVREALDDLRLQISASDAERYLACAAEMEMLAAEYRLRAKAL